ncbi:MAG: DUF1844 domain-containing protein [Terriglobia bacterium]
MPDETPEDHAFKVVDRRPFAVDGTRRTEAPAREEKLPAEPEKPRATSKESRNAADDRVDEGFAMLLDFLTNSAFLQLGLGAGPGGEPLPADLEGARAMIDLLGVVQDKTKGNLSATEQKLLGDVLFELHTRFVEAQRQAATPKRR